MHLSRKLLKPSLHALCAAPLVLTGLRTFGVGGLSLGANPIDELIHEFGSWGLRLLLATLLVTPVQVALRKPWILGVRRLIGLWSFAYLTLHFTTWLVLDQSLVMTAIAADIVKRPYITVGFVALLMLVPLAITSTAGWMRRLGRRWQRLHRLVYAAAILGCVHFWWQVKADWREPLLYAIVLAVLLAWRARRANDRRLVRRGRSPTVATGLQPRLDGAWQAGRRS